MPETAHLLPFRSLYAGFEAAAARRPSAVAISDAGRDLSFAALGHRSRQVARSLIALGIAPGDRVAIWAVNHPEWVIAGLGNQAAGGVLIPASTRLRATELGDILRRARVRVLFCDPSFNDYDFAAAIAAEKLPDLQHIVVFGDGPQSGRTLGWRAFEAAASDVTDDVLDARIANIGPNDLADILFTSGTTGTPKGVPMTQRQSLIACEQQQRCVLQFRDDDVIAVTFPFAHNAGYRAGWQAALLFGVRIVPVRSYDPGDLLQLIEAEKVTILPAVPTIFQMILDHPDRVRHDLSSLRIAATGATTIPVTLIERMQAAFGAEGVRTGYGLTEAAGSVTSTRPGDSATVIAKTTGKPLDNLELKLLGADRRPVAYGTPGEIAVRGPQVMTGYYQDPAASAAAFTTDGFLLTGDIGRFDALGNLSITDRLKDMYIVGGFNVYPAEVEQQLCRIDGVLEAAVIGIADLRLGEVGRAFLVAAPDAELDQARVIAWCRANIANYKVPKVVTFVPHLPRTATGKVSKVELRGIAST